MSKQKKKKRSTGGNSKKPTKQERELILQERTHEINKELAHNVRLDPVEIATYIGLTWMYYAGAPFIFSGLLGIAEAAKEAVEDAWEWVWKPLEGTLRDTPHLYYQARAISGRLDAATQEAIMMEARQIAIEKKEKLIVILETKIDKLEEKKAGFFTESEIKMYEAWITKLQDQLSEIDSTEWEDKETAKKAISLAKYQLFFISMGLAGLTIYIAKAFIAQDAMSI